MEVQCQHTQRGVVGVREVIDDGMQRVTPNIFVFDLAGMDELAISGRCEEWVREIAEEVLQEGSNRGNVVLIAGRVTEVNLR